MTAPAPSAHAARTGAWALLVVLAVDLVFDLVRRLVPIARFDIEVQPGPDWFAWLEWFTDADLPLQALLAALLVVALLRLRRGTADAVAKAMFLGAGFLAVVDIGLQQAFHYAIPWGGLDDADAFARARRFMQAALASERLGAALLLAAIWRVRRAWGRSVGLAWSIAAVLFVVQLALSVGLVVGAPAQVDHALLIRRELMSLALATTEIGALMATLFALARAAPSEPAAARWTAAATGLDTFFRALVARVTIVVLGFVITIAFGFTSPAMRATLLFATLVLALPTAIAQVAGLTRYADAPAPIGRPALGIALVAIGVGLAIEVLTLAMFAAVVWPDRATAFEPARAQTLMLQYAGLAGQLVGLIGTFALIVSLRRAAHTLGSLPLRRRGTKLCLTLLGVVAATFAALWGFGEALARTPVALLGVGLVAVIVGVTVFISWLRLIEGVAQEMRARARLS